jgi:glycosyltransferase involved in cell wall biosynthesis
MALLVAGPVASPNRQYRLSEPNGIGPTRLWCIRRIIATHKSRYALSAHVFSAVAAIPFALVSLVREAAQLSGGSHQGKAEEGLALKVSPERFAVFSNLDFTMTHEIQDFSRRVQVRITDALRNSRAAWEFSSAAALAGACVACALEKQLLLCAVAYRRTSFEFVRERLEARLSPWLDPRRADIWRTAKIGWKRLQHPLADKVLDKGLILKSPGADGEKGVLYLSFEYNWLRLVAYYDLRKLLQEYLLVAASSSSPPDFTSHWALAHIGPDPVFLQISNPSDKERHERLSHNIRPVPIMASDWINPEFYRPRPHPQREIDIVMVAGWSHNKRHWLLFRTLRAMRRNLRVVLIGQNSEGRTADDVWREAKAFGVTGQVEMIRNATIETVTEQQCNSKASVILSAREGSCVVVTESFFADTPVAMMHNAHVGSRAYINRQTGVLLRSETMAAQLSQLIEQSASYGPRAWAMANVTCFHSTRKLNSLLRDYCCEHRIPWTRDIVPFCWRPDPIYVRDADGARMKLAYQDLYERHGVVVTGRTPSENVRIGKTEVTA